LVETYVFKNCLFNCPRRGGSGEGEGKRQKNPSSKGRLNRLVGEKRRVRQKKQRRPWGKGRFLLAGNADGTPQGGARSKWGAAQKRKRKKVSPDRRGGAAAFWQGEGRTYIDTRGEARIWEEGGAGRVVLDKKGRVGGRESLREPHIWRGKRGGGGRVVLGGRNRTSWGSKPPSCGRGQTGLPKTLKPNEGKV